MVPFLSLLKIVWWNKCWQNTIVIQKGTSPEQSSHLKNLPVAAFLNTVTPLTMATWKSTCAKTLLNAPVKTTGLKGRCESFVYCCRNVCCSYGAMFPDLQSAYQNSSQRIFTAGRSLPSSSNLCRSYLWIDRINHRSSRCYAWDFFGEKTDLKIERIKKVIADLVQNTSIGRTRNWASLVAPPKTAFASVNGQLRLKRKKLIYWRISMTAGEWLGEWAHLYTQVICSSRPMDFYFPDMASGDLHPYRFRASVATLQELPGYPLLISNMPKPIIYREKKISGEVTGERKLLCNNY